MSEPNPRKRARSNHDESEVPLKKIKTLEHETSETDTLSLDTNDDDPEELSLSDTQDTVHSDSSLSLTSKSDDFANQKLTIAVGVSTDTVKDLKKRVKMSAKTSERLGTTLYLGHIPHGFYEKEMQTFFSQFGEVERVKVARNKKGKSKGYAFIQFRHKEVADIVAETMHNYMMYGRMLVCKVLENSLDAYFSKDNDVNWKEQFLEFVRTHNKSDSNVHRKRLFKWKKTDARRKRKLQRIGIDLKQNESFAIPAPKIPAKQEKAQNNQEKKKKKSEKVPQ
eukprot:TRINITY_DN3872_c0_g1_i1.p1 TRINITY_DN3872_c0_g1~~TRINITY_DN3872_c0_g1_i1.p1  ORF type:complete len:280 (+),score=46.64 TRINITY_DN3872_c0_g1_i1:51-890(+)